MDYKELNNYLTNYSKLSTDLGTSNAYDIKINEMVCPCCGKKLRLTDTTKKEFEGASLFSTALLLSTAASTFVKSMLSSG